MVRREIAPTSQALQVAFSRLFREPMLSESTSFGSRWGIYEMSFREPGGLQDAERRSRPSGVAAAGGRRDCVSPSCLRDEGIYLRAGPGYRTGGLGGIRGGPY